MKRPVTKPRAKNIRRAVAALRKLGAVDISVTVNGHYFLSWIFQAIAMQIGLARSAGRSAFERAMSEIRAEFRRQHLLVPM